MEYRVKIHEDKPFIKKIKLTHDYKTIKKSQTAEVLYLNDDGSIEKSVEYGYVTSKEIKQLLESKKVIDLEWCYVSNLDIKGGEIDNLWANSAFLDNDTNIRWVDFVGAVGFEETIFNGKANFSNTFFRKGVSFHDVRFNRQALFFEAKFLFISDFIDAIFRGYADFRCSVFKDLIHFDNVTFTDKADFANAVFDDRTDFSTVHFKNHANYRNVTFKERANFDHAVFDMYTDYKNTTFNELADFRFTEFNEFADFNLSLFKDEVNFDNAIIKKIRFNNIKFPSDVSFKFVECNHINLQNCTIERSLDFGTQVEFEELSFLGLRNFGTLLLDWNKNNLKNAIYTYGKNNSLSYYALGNAFNLLKVNFNSIGQYNDEDEAYVEYRRCMRRSLTRSLHSNKENVTLPQKIKRLITYIIRRFKVFCNWLFLDVISCYCTRWLRVLISAFITIIFFGLLYYVTATVEFSDNYNGIAGCFYHSIITFFTIGYGDSNPSQIMGLLLTGLEGFIGIFLMSLFTVSFVRKALR